MIQKTSTSAYYLDILPNLGERHRAVLQMFIEGKTYTNTELAIHLNWPINTVTPRIHELRKKNMIVETERRPCKVTNRMAIVWGLNQALEVKEY